MSRRLAIPVALAAFGALLAAPRPAGATGAYTLSTFFTYRTHPDFPLDDFATGKLGLLHPGFRREYLAVAWRYLRGGKLDPAERAAAVEVMRARLRLPADLAAQRKAAEARVAAWLKARNLVRGARPTAEIKQYKESSLWVEYANCLPDAFDTAARTLRDRVARLGADSPEVKGWLAAQDQVFAACGSQDDSEGAAAARAALPEELPPAASASARFDRDYQIAAALFYRGRFEEAAERFHRIARQPESPWAPLGNYLAARALIRKATLAPSLDRAALTDAERELAAMALPGTTGDHAWQGRSERLLGHVQARLHPEEQLRAVARRVDKGSRDLKNDLTDYLWLLSATRGALGAGAVQPPEDLDAPLVDLARLRAEDEMTDFVLTLASALPGEDDEAAARGAAAALTHVLDRYRATHALPWLVAAAMTIPAGHPEAAAILEAAERVPEASPARETLSYHALRLHIESGRPERLALARERLDALLPSLRAGRPGATLNRFLELRLRVAASLDELVAAAQRHVLGTGFEDDEFEVPDEVAAPGRKRAGVQPVRLDDDGAQLLRARLPLALLVKLLDHPQLAEGLKQELTRALFVRAVLIEDLATARQLLPLAQALPEGAPAWKEGLAAFAAATDDQERAFSALFMILKLPGLRPWVDAGAGRQTPLPRQDEFRDNWWCSPGSSAVTRARPGDTRLPALPSPAFLDEAQRTAAEAEATRLARLGAGANLMAARVIDYARAHPDDARLPEALFLVNRATHFGCTDDKTSNWSKQAYLVLHKNWPRNHWARRVKYWW